MEVGLVLKSAREPGAQARSRLAGSRRLRTADGVAVDLQVAGDRGGLVRAREALRPETPLGEGTKSRSLGLQCRSMGTRIGDSPMHRVRRHQL